jgi:hypothetical protein
MKLLYHPDTVLQPLSSKNKRLVFYRNFLSPESMPQSSTLGSSGKRLLKQPSIRSRSRLLPTLLGGCTPMITRLHSFTPFRRDPRESVYSVGRGAGCTDTLLGYEGVTQQLSYPGFHAFCSLNTRWLSFVPGKALDGRKSSFRGLRRIVVS